MIQDIAPHKLDISFCKKDICDNDYILSFDKNLVVLKDDYTLLNFLDVKDFLNDELIYLFSIDNIGFYLSMNGFEALKDRFITKEISIFRELQPLYMAFAGITGFHLYNWYLSNKYCGRCGGVNTFSEKERAMCCCECNNTVYPKICPAVIVAVTDKNRILMTKYADREYKKYALIAGFVEIGETLEDTVRREVMEEVGLKVKNIRYYKNQPWAFSSSILVGFFAELDSDDFIELDENELSEAKWFEREDIPYNNSTISLTNEMIEAFRNKTF